MLSFLDKKHKKYQIIFGRIRDKQDYLITLFKPVDGIKLAHI